MHEHALPLLMAASILFFGAVSRRAERSPITAPMAFLALGLLVGKWGLDWIPLETDSKLIDLLGEFALILVLFTDASRIDLSSLREAASLPTRLLGLGLPLAIGAGALAALGLFPEFGVWEALLLAAILAPTDAALGQAVVSSPLVPQRIRQTLNVESGLNDGMALPVVLLSVSLIATSGGDRDTLDWLGFAAVQIGLAPVVGALVGFLGGRLVSETSDAGWMSRPFQHLSALALSVLAFALAESLGANGFISVFVAGAVLGNSAATICECVHDFGEAEGQLLALAMFFLLGAVLAPAQVGQIDPRHLVYALLSLTLIRGIPVLLSLAGSGLDGRSIAFLAWFGPRGLASVLYMLIALEGGALGNHPEIATVITWTVLLSTLAHGLTAYPLAKAYGEYAARAREVGGCGPEYEPTVDARVRVRFE